MNTKRLFFGLLAVAFLAMTAVATPVIDLEEDQKTSIKRDRIKQL